MRAKSASVAERNQPLLAQIQTLKSKHPLWGYRRIWSYLRFRQGALINKKRIFRLMTERQLLVTKNFRLKAKRTTLRPKPHADRPNQFWGIDMTKIKMAGWGWLYLCVVLDWYSKEIIGYSLGIQSKTEDWLISLSRAVNERFPQGIQAPHPEIFLISDNSCQPTSQRFMQACSTLGIKQIFTTWSNPKRQLRHRARHAHHQGGHRLALRLGQPLRLRDRHLCLDSALQHRLPAPGSEQSHTQANIRIVCQRTTKTTAGTH